MLVLAILVTFVAYANAQTKDLLTAVPTKPAIPSDMPMTAVTTKMPAPPVKGTTLIPPPTIMPVTELPTKQPVASCRVSADCGKATSGCGFDCESGRCLMWCTSGPAPAPEPVEPRPTTPPTQTIKCSTTADCGRAEAYCSNECSSSGYCVKLCQTSQPLDGNGSQRLDSGPPVIEAMAASTSTSALTCKDIKAAYQQQNCCKNPMGNFTLPTQRRLFDRSADDEIDNAYNEVLRQVEAGMVHMRNIGGAAKTERLARAVVDLLAPLAQTHDAVV